MEFKDLKIDKNMELRKDFRRYLDLILKDNKSFEDKMLEIFNKTYKFSNTMVINVNNDFNTINLKADKNLFFINKHGLIFSKSFLNTFKTLDNFNISLFLKPNNINQINYGYQFSLLFPYNIAKNKIYFELFNTYLNNQSSKLMIQNNYYKGIKVIDKKWNLYFNFYYKNSKDSNPDLSKVDLIKINDTGFYFDLKKKFNYDFIKNELLFNYRYKNIITTSIRTKGILDINNILNISYYSRYFYFHNKGFYLLNNYLPFNSLFKKVSIQNEKNILFFNTSFNLTNLKIFNKIKAKLSLNYYNFNIFNKIDEINSNHLINLEIQNKIYKSMFLCFDYNLFANGELINNNYKKFGIKLSFGDN